MLTHFYMRTTSFPRSFAENTTFSLVYIFDASVKHSMVGFVSDFSIQFPDLNFCGWVGCLIACFTNTRLLLDSVVVFWAVHRCYDASTITLDS